MKPLALVALAAIILLLSLPARGQLALHKPPAERPETSYVMKKGAYLGFSQVNLSMGEIGFEVKVSSNVKGKSGPTLEFRIDKPKGKKIGTLRIPHTADTVHAIKLIGQLRHAIGVHDLYLVAGGDGEFNITGFAFIHNFWLE
ncbi:carbohydrate-binding protein [Chitinophaga lutea]